MVDIKRQQEQLGGTKGASTKHSAQASADSFGGAQAREMASLARAAAAVGGAAAQFAEKDRVEAEKARIEAAKASQSRLRDADASSRLKQLEVADWAKGFKENAALGVAPVAQKKLAKIRDEVMKTLKTDEERRIFRRISDVREAGYMSRIKTHMSAEVERWRLRSLNDHQAVLHKEYQRQVGEDPEAATKTLRLMQQNAFTLHRDKGPVTLKKEMMKLLDGVHGEAVATLATEDPQKALHYLKQHRHDLSRSAYASAKTALEDQIIDVRADAMARKYLDQSGYGDAVERVLNNKSLKRPMRDKLLERLGFYDGQQRRAQTAKENAELDAMQDGLAKAYEDGTLTYTNLHKFFPADSAVPPARRHEIKRVWEARLRAEAEQDQTAYYDSTYQRAMLFAEENPTLFSEFNFRDTMAQYRFADYRKITELQSRIKSGQQTRADKAIRRVMSAWAQYPENRKPTTQQYPDELGGIYQPFRQGKPTPFSDAMHKWLGRRSRVRAWVAGALAQIPPEKMSEEAIQSIEKTIGYKFDMELDGEVPLYELDIQRALHQDKKVKIASTTRAQLKASYPLLTDEAINNYDHNTQTFTESNLDNVKRILTQTGRGLRYLYREQVNGKEVAQEDPIEALIFTIDGRVKFFITKAGRTLRSGSGERYVESGAR
jgi:hypothetical protein